MIKKLILRLPQFLIIFILLKNIDFCYANNVMCTKTATRPFYVIGHMSNSIEEVKKFVSCGANSIEIDIQFTDDGLLDVVYHGIPCDCFRYCNAREDVNLMLEYLKDISTPGNLEYAPHFNLLYIDLKIRRLSEKAKTTAGILLADKLINILFDNDQGSSKLNVITGLELITDYPFVYALVDRFNQRNFANLLSRIGFDVSGNDNIESIDYLWKYMFENKLNVWQGDGITNCLSYIRTTQRLKDLIKIRENNYTKPFLSKVYHWTIDSKWTIKESLRFNIDGILTNDVTQVIDLLNNDEFKSMYHLANDDDDPFCLVQESDIKRNFKNQNFYNNLLVPNYIMNNNPELTSSQSINQNNLKINYNNFESDNLIRTVSVTGNDFKRNSLSDFNLRQLISQVISYIKRRNTYDKLIN